MYIFNLWPIMRIHRIIALALAPLLFLGTSGTSGIAGVDSPISPDGVGLHDYQNGSTVWGRTFEFQPPPGTHETEVFSLCAFEGEGSGAAMWACLEPFIKDVRWTVPGSPTSAFQAVWHGGDEAPPTLPARITVEPVTTVIATMQTDDFTIHDNVDCCNNKNAEGYVYLWVYGTAGWSQSPKLVCDDQSTSSGHCGVGAIGTFQLTTVGPNSCDGILGQVEFWDEDTSSDDRMDISSKLNDAVANIQATTSPQTGTCANEDGEWWSERGNTDSPSANRCHAITLSTICGLTGQYDTTGDNDDATLDFEII